jgi:N-acetylmuramoyl-L-alanine amidase
LWFEKRDKKTQISPKPVAQKPVEAPKPPIKHDVKGEYYTVNIADPNKNDNTISYGSIVSANPKGYTITKNYFPAVAQNFRQKYVIFIIQLLIMINL